MPADRLPSSYINIKKILNLLFREIQRSFMVRPSSINHNAMNSASLLNNLVHRSRDAVLVGDVGLDGSNAAGEPLEDGCELVAGLCEIDRVDFGRVVDQAAFGDAEPDSAVPAGYLGYVEWLDFGLDGVGFLAHQLSLFRSVLIAA